MPLTLREEPGFLEDIRQSLSHVRFNGQLTDVASGVVAYHRAKEGGLGSLTPFLPRIRHAFLIGEAAGPFAAGLVGG